MSNNTSKPAILLDFKKDRIRIYKRTLHFIGDPAYILLLVNIIVRLTTPKELQKCSLSDESWLIVFKLRKSIDPIICKVEVPEY